MKAFLPYPEISNHQVIIVDGKHPEKFTLSHWKGSGTPEKLKADTSAEIVLNAIEEDIPELNYPFVSATHFDIDGLVGVMALFEPEWALAHKELLIRIATLGDFRTFEPEKEIDRHALQLCCWINAVEKENFYRPFGEVDELQACVPKFEFFLKAFKNAVENTDHPLIQKAWKAEYRQVMNEVYTLATKGKVETRKELNLLLVEAPHPLHYYALFHQSHGCDLVLSLYSAQRYELEYKYTGWVEIQSYKQFPRIDLRPLAESLNRQENSEYHWQIDPITDTGPILRLEKEGLSKADRYANPTERPVYSSSIPANEFKDTVFSFLEEKLRQVKKKSNWSWQEMRKMNRQLEQI
jgi:hypothetical protein